MADPRLKQKLAAGRFIVAPGVFDTAGGDYGSEGHVWQAYQPLPVFDGNHALVGSWVIAGEPAGIGMREDERRITHNTSRFVPHFFRNPP